MTDVLTREQRSLCMSRVRGGNTSPEMVVRSTLHKLGFRFRLHRRDLPGTPDVVLPRWNTIIFVHGCFWHGHGGCRRAERPESNAEFWRMKLDSNIQRDERNRRELNALGWKVLTVWECETRKANLEGRLLELLS